MNRKGETGIGALIIGAIAILVTLTMLPAIAQNAVGDQSLVSVVNYTFTAGAVDTYVTLPGRINTTAIIVRNSTEDLMMDKDVKIVSLYDSTGALAIRLKTNASTTNAEGAMNASYTYQPSGYIQESSGRTISALIVLFACLAIAVVAFGGTRIVELFDI